MEHQPHADRRRLAGRHRLRRRAPIATTRPTRCSRASRSTATRCAPRRSTLGYAREYGQALWRLRKLVRRLSRERRFDVVHACNPPDLLLLAARSLRRQGTRFIFDHHDLVPELYRSRFGRGEDLGYRATLRAERVAYRHGRRRRWPPTGPTRRVAVERGGMDPEDVFVVRNGPDLTRFRPVPSPTRRGAAGAPT